MKNIGVFAILIYNNQIVLCKRNYGNFNWTLPGGAVEENENISEALKREVYEETGQVIEDFKYVITSYSKMNYSIAIIYVVKLHAISDFLFSRRELENVKLFELSKLPKNISDRQKKWIKFGCNEQKNAQMLEL